MNEWERQEEREVNKKLYNLANPNFFTFMPTHCGMNVKKLKYTNPNKVDFFIF